MISRDICSDRVSVKILIIDTATSASSVAITVDGALLSECFANPERKHSASLMRILDQTLGDAGLSIEDMQVIAVTVGPGSFTGLRVGIATAKGLALATGVPLVGISTLAMLAMNLPHAALPVCPMLDARKNEVYTALFRCHEYPEQLAPERVIKPADFLETIREPTLFLGSGALRYRELLRNRLGDKALFAPAHCHELRASAGALLAARSISAGEALSPAELVPVYLRQSEAELALNSRPMTA